MEIAAIPPSHGLGGRARAFDWFDQRRAGSVASRLDRVLPRCTFRRISKKPCVAAKRITMMRSFSCRPCRLAGDALSWSHPERLPKVLIGFGHLARAIGGFPASGHPFRHAGSYVERRVPTLRRADPPRSSSAGGHFQDRRRLFHEAAGVGDDAHDPVAWVRPAGDACGAKLAIQDVAAVTAAGDAVVDEQRGYDLAAVPHARHQVLSGGLLRRSVSRSLSTTSLPSVPRWRNFPLPAMSRRWARAASVIPFATAR